MPLDVHATPREVTIAGRTFRIRPPRRVDLAEFVAWAQDRDNDAGIAFARRAENEQHEAHMQRARQAAESLPEADRADYLKHAADKAQQAASEEGRRIRDRIFDRTARYSMAHQNVITEIGKPDGAAKLLWLCIRTEHPEITEDELYDLCNSEEAIADATGAIERVMAGDGDAGEGSGARKKKPKGKTATRTRKKKSR